MRFIIREKVFSFGDDFIIKDEFGNSYFKVKGKVFALGDKLKLYDMQGNEIVYIEQQLFRFLPEYLIYYHGQRVAKVKKQFSILNPRFNIESSLGTFTISGNILGMNFSIYKNNQCVAQVSKKWFSFSDSYGVDINDSEDYAFILSLAIIIDQVLHDNRHKN